MYLEIADVHDYAKVTLNGKELGAAGWQPYRWDVTGALKKGTNDLVIEVDALATGGRGGPGGPPPAAAPAAATTAPGLAAAPPAGQGPGADAGARRRSGAGVAGTPGQQPPGRVHRPRELAQVAVDAAEQPRPQPPASSARQAGRRISFRLPRLRRPRPRQASACGFRLVYTLAISQG